MYSSYDFSLRVVACVVREAPFLIGLQNADLERGRGWQEDTPFKGIPTDSLSPGRPTFQFLPHLIWPIKKKIYP